ncbi:MAG: AsmA family protein [Zetaproteobacteria bacterium]|nr:MAG: AsmA family protein [Zetaproteobacteria bacterium]
MNKAARKTVKYSLILLALLAVALLAAPFFIDINHYKGLIIEKAEQATGRRVEIGGLHASFFPWVGVRLDDVGIANRQGFSNEDFLQVKSLDVRLALLPLLSKRVEIKRFVLDSPKLLLERDASGAGNWEDLLPATKEEKSADVVGGMQTPAPTGGGASLVALSAKSLRMLNGEVHYRDMRSGSDITLSEFGIEVDGVQLDQPVHVQASGKLSGDTFSVKAEVGPLGDLSKFNAGKLPLQADIQAKSIALEKFTAFIPALTGLGAGTLAVDVRIEQRPDGLRVTAGTLALRGEHEADVAWKIEMPKPDRMKLDRVVLRVEGEKAAEMTGSVRGIGNGLQYQVRINTPTLSRKQLSAWMPDLQALYAAHPAPWKQVKLGLLAAGDAKHVELRDLQLILNKELVQASGNVRFGAGPVVRLRIASKSLHIDPWLPQPEKDKAQSLTSVNDKPGIHMIPYASAEGARIGQQQTGSRNADAAGARIGQPQAVNMPADTGTAEPDLRFLKSWRVTAGLQVDHLFLHGLDLAYLHATLSGKRGTFTMDPFRFELAGGQVREKASVNVSLYPARWTESVKVRGVQVQPVLKALAGTDMIAGVMQMDTKLSGVGLLPQTATQSLNGTGHVLLRDGMIKGFDIAGTLRSITAPGQQGGSRQTDFSQLSGSFKVRNGVASNDDLFMASPLFRLTGYGQVDLVAKNMDYHVKPRLVGSLAGQGDTEAVRKGLVIPLRITGPLDAPRVKVEMDIKTLMGNVGNIKDILKGGKGGLKGILKGVLQGGPASGNPAPDAAPAPSQAPAKPVDQILRKLKIPGF